MAAVVVEAAMDKVTPITMVVGVTMAMPSWEAAAVGEAVVVLPHPRYNCQTHHPRLLRLPISFQL